PFDRVRAVNGHFIRDGWALTEEVRRHPIGTSFHYLVSRRGEAVEVDVRSERITLRDFHRYLLEGFLPGMLFLALGAVVVLLKPGAPETRLFLAFCVASSAVPALYADAFSVHRFQVLFYSAFAFLPALLVHLALTFPERRRIVRRYPRLVWLPYVPAAL